MPDQTTETTATPAESQLPDSQVQPGGDFEDRLIPIDLIDEPELAVRETMEEEELASLAISIMEIGLVKPITVNPLGGRYITIAGHRRLLACRIANYSPVPCRIPKRAGVDPLAILVHENAEVEKVNPVHEARFYQRLLVEKCGNDCDRLAALVKRTRKHVEDRLLLVMGDPDVLKAVERRHISLAIAELLNRPIDPNRRRILLDVAIQSGCNAKQMKEWIRQGAELGDIIIEPAGGGQADAPAQPFIESNPMTCMFCESSEHTHMMEMIWLHHPCKDLLLKILQRGAPPAA